MTEERDELVEKIGRALTKTPREALQGWADLEAAYTWPRIVGPGTGRTYRWTMRPLIAHGIVIRLNEFWRDENGEPIWQFYALTELGKAVMAWLEENG